MNPIFNGIRFGTHMESAHDWMIKSLEMMAAKNPMIYVELGCASAHTLSGVCRVMDALGSEWIAYGVDLATGGWRYNASDIKDNLKPWGCQFLDSPTDFPSASIRVPSIATYGSEAFLKEIAGCIPVDVMFIDACHSAPCCTRDFILAERVVRQGGIVIFHDTDIQSQGDDFEIQPHCNLGIGVRRAIQAMDLFNGKRIGWKLLADVDPRPEHGGKGGRGIVVVQKI